MEDRIIKETGRASGGSDDSSKEENGNHSSDPVCGSGQKEKGKEMRNAVRRVVGIFFCLTLTVQLLADMPGGSRTTVAKAKSVYDITDKERDAFFGKSAIIGNSVGLGLKYYFDRQPSGYLGGPKMLVWGSYSFLNDFNNDTEYMIHWKGQPMKARNAVKACGAKHVFINMGTNDFNTSRENIYNNYKRFIREIKTTNPDVDIFILATTPTRQDKGLLSNAEANKLNAKMKNLAAKRGDMYYIDINSPMKDSSGLLRSDFTSDGFVHLTWAAYKVWTDKMVGFAKNLLKKQKKAKLLARKAAKNLKMSTYLKAKEVIGRLDKSKLRTALRNKLKIILKKINKAEKRAVAPAVNTRKMAGTGSTQDPTVKPMTGLSLEEQSMVDAFKSGKVTKVKVERKIEKNVRLSWDTQNGADSYVIYRSIQKHGGVYRIVGKTKKTAFIDKKARKKKTYYYRVQGRMKIRAKYYKGKRSQVKDAYITPATPKTVIAGECFVVGMERYTSVFNSNHRFVGKIGVNTYTMMHSNYFTYNGQSITGLERIAYHKPDRVIFIIGANESAWYQVNLTMQNYTQMRKLLRKVNPHMEIVLVKIAPFGYHPTESTASVSRRAKWNNAYKKFADDNEDTYYCPATDCLDDGNSHLLSRYDAGDGTHWNGSGTELVVKEIRKWSKKTLGNW